MKWVNSAPYVRSSIYSPVFYPFTAVSMVRTCWCLLSLSHRYMFSKLEWTIGAIWYQPLIRYKLLDYKPWLCRLKSLNCMLEFWLLICKTGILNQLTHQALLSIKDYNIFRETWPCIWFILDTIFILDKCEFLYKLWTNRSFILEHYRQNQRLSILQTSLLEMIFIIIINWPGWFIFT